MNLTKLTTLYFGVDGNIVNYTTPGGMGTNAVWNNIRVMNPLMMPVEYSDGTIPTFGRDNLISPYAALNYYGYKDQNSTRNMTTLKLTQKFNGVLQGLEASVQAMICLLYTSRCV